MTLQEHAVLLVDDDRDLAHGAALRLRAAGFRTDTAQSGKEGLRKAVNAQPHAIVLDVRMPGMDGLETLGELRRHHRTQGIPIVMLSASLIDRQAALDAGARFFVDKPYESAKLVCAVSKAIEENTADLYQRPESQ